MPWGVAAAIGGAAVSAYGANRAAKKANQGAQAGADAQLNMFNQSRDDLSPYRDLGTNYAIPGLQNFVSQGGLDAPTAANVTSMPGYQFGLDQGVKGIENSALARGGLLSGNSMRAISQFGQDYANSQWDKYQARNTNTLNNWLALTNVGQNSASGSASNAMNTGNALANIYANQGNNAAQYSLAPYQVAANGLGTYAGYKMAKG